MVPKVEGSVRIVGSLPGLEEAEEERFQMEELGMNIQRLVINYGFAEDPDIPRALARCRLCGEAFKVMETTFFLSREHLIASKKPGMAVWRKHLFIFMSRNAVGAFSFFRLTSNRVVELGMQLEI